MRSLLYGWNVVSSITTVWWLCHENIMQFAISERGFLPSYEADFWVGKQLRNMRSQNADRKNLTTMLPRGMKPGAWVGCLIRSKPRWCRCLLVILRVPQMNTRCLSYRNIPLWDDDVIINLQIFRTHKTDQQMRKWLRFKWKIADAGTSLTAKLATRYARTYVTTQSHASSSLLLAAWWRSLLLAVTIPPTPGASISSGDVSDDNIMANAPVHSRRRYEKLWKEAYSDLIVFAPRPGLDRIRNQTGLN